MMEVSNVSKEGIFILVIVSMAIWTMVSREAVKPSKEIGKLAENDNITVCRIFICIRYNHYAFSKPAIIVPLTSAIINQGDELLVPLFLLIAYVVIQKTMLILLC